MSTGCKVVDLRPNYATSNSIQTKYCAKSALTSYLPGGSHHHHHLLQVELVPRQGFNSDLVLHVAARLSGVVEEFPQMANPGLQKDELGRETL